MNKEQVWTELQKHMRDVLPFLKEDDYDQKKRFSDLGANSIDRAHIIVMTLETLDLNIPLTETVKAQNIGELVDLLHGRLHSA